MTCPSNNHTEQTAQGSQRGQILWAPSPWTCCFLYFGSSFSSFLPRLSPWKIFQSLPPTPWFKPLGCPSNMMCMALSLLPSHCLLRACWMFYACTGGSHKVKDGNCWPYLPGMELLNGCLWRERKIACPPVCLSLKTVSWKTQWIPHEWFWLIAINKSKWFLFSL